MARKSISIPEAMAALVDANQSIREANEVLETAIGLLNQLSIPEEDERFARFVSQRDAVILAMNERKERIAGAIAGKVKKLPSTKLLELLKIEEVRKVLA